MTISPSGTNLYQIPPFDVDSIPPSLPEASVHNENGDRIVQGMEKLSGAATAGDEAAKSGEELKRVATNLAGEKEIDPRRFKSINQLSKILLPLSLAGVIYGVVKIAKVVRESNETKNGAISSVRQHLSLVTKGRIGKKVAKAFLKIGKSTEKSVKIAKEFFRSNGENAKAVIELKEIGAVVMAPFAVASLVKNIVAFKRGGKAEVAAQVIDIVDDTKEIGENVSTIVTSLAEAKVLSPLRVAWLKPFSYVLTALSIVDVVTSVIDTVKMVKLLRKIKVELKCCGESLNGSDRLMRVVELLNKKEVKSEGFIKETFGVKPEQFSTAFIMDRIDQKDEIGSEAISLKLIKRLKGRVKSNIVSSSISGISSLAGTVGSALLIINPAMTGAIYLVCSTLLADIGERLYHRVIDFRFVRKLGISRTKLEWLNA